MKKTILAVLFCCLFLTSCGLNIGDFLESKPYDPKEIFADDYPFAVETMEEILRCLDEEDSESLKKLLSQEVLDRVETDKEIEEIMKVYDGKSVLHDDFHQGIATSASRDRQYIQKSIYIYTENLITDTGFHCEVFVYYALVNEDADKIGVSSVYILNDDGTEMCAVNSCHKS